MLSGKIGDCYCVDGDLHFRWCFLIDLALNNSVENGHLPKGDSWAVHKFGGTCVGNSERIKDVADVVVKDDSERKLVVVSAMAKVTDMMYDLIHRAQSRDDSYLSALSSVLEKHRATAVDLLDGDELASFLARLNDDINNLKAMLRAIYIGTVFFPFVNSQCILLGGGIK